MEPRYTSSLPLDGRIEWKDSLDQPPDSRTRSRDPFGRRDHYHHYLSNSPKADHWNKRERHLRSSSLRKWHARCILQSEEAVRVSPRSSHFHRLFPFPKYTGFCRSRWNSLPLGLQQCFLHQSHSFENKILCSNHLHDL